MRIILLLSFFLTFYSFAQNIPTAISQVYEGEIIFDFSQNSGRAEGKWTQGQNMPFPRYYGGSVMYSKNDTTWLYVLGGDTTGGGIASTACLRYNVNTDSWEYIAPLPSPMRVNSAALLGDKIYTMGGFKAPFPDPEINKFYEYDINTNTWFELPDLPEGIFFHKAFGYQDSIIYIAGGMITSTIRDTPLDKVLKFYPSQLLFKDADPLPEAKAAAGLGITDNGFVISGGIASTTTYSTVTFVANINPGNPSQISYSTGIDYPINAYGMYAYPHNNNEVYFHGGNSSLTGFAPISNSYNYKLTENHFEEEPNLPYPAMAFHSGYKLPNQREEQVIIVVIAGGVTTGPAITGQTWVYRDTIKTTGLQEISDQVPENFMLYQNYPNPFNPDTKIEFSIPEQSFVKLEIFNLIGERISVLVSEELSAGTYNYIWTAHSEGTLPSGTYFYRLTAKEFVQTKKLLLLK